MGGVEGLVSEWGPREEGRSTADEGNCAAVGPITGGNEFWQEVLMKSEEL